MAAYTDHYMSDFVLHGTSDNQFMAKVHSDLSMAVQVFAFSIQIQFCFYKFTLDGLPNASY